MTKNRPPTHFLKVIFIISILLLFCFPKTSLLQTTSVEYISFGTDYETPVYIIKTDYKEPTIMIVAGTHGNEKAGIKAAEYLKDNLLLVDPVKGSTAYCAYHQLGIPALTFETCRKLPLSFRIEEQIKFVKIILSKWDMFVAVQK